MKDNFRGWTFVYAFTFRQSAKGAFKLITVIAALIIMGAFIVTNVVVAKPDKDKKVKPSPIKKVYILDTSGLQPTNYKVLFSQLGVKQFENTEFVEAKNAYPFELVKSARSRENNSEAIAVIISAKESTFEINAVIPEGSKITKSQAEELLKPMSSAFQSNKLMQAGLSEAQLKAVLKPSVVSFSDVGESTSQVTKAIKLAAPMLFSFILYFMILIYGQNVSKSVSTEKTSKLMDVLLISVHPYALISGKVLAVTTMAIIQFVIWIGAGVAGLYGGNAVAHAIYPSYQNTAVIIINYVRDNIGETALTIPAVVLSVVIFCIGFLFYCVIAAVAGSMVSKPEDVAATHAVFQFPVVISWLVCYLAPITRKAGLLTSIRLIPLTSPFSVPADLITGTIGLGMGIISLAILMIFSLLTIILAARIYKGLVLYTGQKFGLRMIGNVLKTNK